MRLSTRCLACVSLTEKPFAFTAAHSLPMKSIESQLPLSQESDLPELKPLHLGKEVTQGDLASKIMIVDDEPINVTIARKYLNLAGYESSSPPPIHGR